LEVGRGGKADVGGAMEGRDKREIAAVAIGGEGKRMCCTKFFVVCFFFFFFFFFFFSEIRN
jgi:hypothetical protein